MEEYERMGYKELKRLKGMCVLVMYMLMPASLSTFIVLMSFEPSNVHFKIGIIGGILILFSAIFFPVNFFILRKLIKEVERSAIDY